MQKVISINLNGNAYQLEESGYEALRGYLAHAQRELQENPDRAEIMADLEQAVADKCRNFLGPHKSVVTAGEVDRIIREMGPVDASGNDDAGEDADASPFPGAKSHETGPPPPRRLYRITDGAMIAGVCNGLGAFLQVDAALVRVAFVAAAVLTQGFGIIAYVILMFVIPEAKTSGERAAAGGAPFNAKEVIDRARGQYAEGSRQWRRYWRRQRRQWRRYGAPAGVPVAYGPPPWALVLLPVFGLVHVALFLIMAAMLISLVNTGAILGWRLPPDVPVWAGALILLIGYQIAVSPIRAAQHWSWYPRAEVQPGWFAFWSAVLWLLALAFVIWVASNHVPEIREFLQRLPDLLREFTYTIRDLGRR